MNGVPGIFDSTSHSAQMRAVSVDIGHRYQVLKFLGHGANSTVWQAVDRQCGVDVAVKRYVPAVGDRAGNFYREVKTLLRLRSSRIAALLNLFEASSGARYLFLDYCPGGTLRAALNGARRHGDRCSPDRAFEIAGQLAEALSDAHREGVIHRDVKPENVLFDVRENRPLAGTAKAKLVDFGIAGLSRSVVLHAALSGTDISGTPAYMAPEQFAGCSTPFSDWYSLGVVLFELLHGRRPFEGGIPELAKQHLYTEPVFHACLDGRQVEILASLLSKDPEDRTAGRVGLLGWRDSGDPPSTTFPPAHRNSNAITARYLAKFGSGQTRISIPDHATTGRHCVGKSVCCLTVSRDCGPAYLVGSAVGIWRFRAADGSPQGVWASSPANAIAVDAVGGVWLASTNRVEHRSGDEPAPWRQFALLPEPILALAPSMDGRRCAALTNRALYGFDSRGGAWAWRSPLTCLGLTARTIDPGILRAVDSGGWLVARSGDEPAVLSIDPRGKLVHATPLPGACRELESHASDRGWLTLLEVSGESRLAFIHPESRSIGYEGRLPNLRCATSNFDATIYAIDARGELLRRTRRTAESGCPLERSAIASWRSHGPIIPSDAVPRSMVATADSVACLADYKSASWIFWWKPTVRDVTTNVSNVGAREVLGLASHEEIQ